jgi:ATP-dependent DNA helicase RecQ
MDEILSLYKGEPAELVKAIFDFARRGRIWFSLNPDEAAEALGQPRRRICRALEVLEEKAMVELRASDVRNRYTCLKPDSDPAELTTELETRFLKREQQERDRIRQVLDLVTHSGCQTAFLAAHFGEVLKDACGHCTYCATGRAQSLPDLAPLAPLPAGLDVPAFNALRKAHPDALGEPRSAARFLCGLTSPAFARAKISRHSLFGALADFPFHDIMAWASLT